MSTEDEKNAETGAGFLELFSRLASHSKTSCGQDIQASPQSSGQESKSLLEKLETSEDLGMCQRISRDPEQASWEGAPAGGGRMHGRGTHQLCSWGYQEKRDLFLCRVKLGNLEKLGKEAFLALR